MFVQKKTSNISLQIHQTTCFQLGTLKYMSLNENIIRNVHKQHSGEWINERLKYAINWTKAKKRKVLENYSLFSIHRYEFHKKIRWKLREYSWRDFSNYKICDSIHSDTKHEKKINKTFVTLAK